MAESGAPRRKSVFSKEAYRASVNGSLNQKVKNIDIRPLSDKLLDFLPRSVPYVLAFMGFLTLITPISFLIFSLFLVTIYFLLSRQVDYLACIPYHDHAKHPSKCERTSFMGEYKKGDALMLVGYCLVTGAQIWVDVDRETRMNLIAGTTGSGKTVFLNAELAFTAAQAVSFKGGAPSLLCDGKGTVAGLMDWMYIMRRFGLVDNIRICNFLTGGTRQNPNAMLDEHFTSHRFNLFSVVNDTEAVTLVMSFGRSDEGGNSGFFKDRASDMIAGTFKLGTYLRDNHGEPLDAQSIRKNTELRTMLKNAGRNDLPDEVLRPLREYLKSLNGIHDHSFDESIDWATEEINQKAEEQHTYNRSTLTKTLNTMAETFGHIFCSTGSEFNPRTAFRHGQNLFCLLPTIERTHDEMAELGRTLIGSLRPAFSVLMGHEVQGSYKQTVDSLSSIDRIIPIRVWFDEVLNYYTKGIASFLSLLRSSKISFRLLAQSMKGFEDAGVSEGHQAKANLGQLFLFSNQDIYDSAEFLEKKMGKQQVARLYQMNANSWGMYNNSGVIQMQEDTAINAKDLSMADSGEGLYIFRGTAIPFRAPYIGESKEDKIKKKNMDFFLSIFAPLLPPMESEVDNYIFNQYGHNNFNDINKQDTEIENNEIISNYVQALFQTHTKNENSKVLATKNISESVRIALADNVATIKYQIYKNTSQSLQDKAQDQSTERTADINQQKLNSNANAHAVVSFDPTSSTVIDSAMPPAEQPTAMPPAEQSTAMPPEESLQHDALHIRERQASKIGIKSTVLPKPRHRTIETPTATAEVTDTFIFDADDVSAKLISTNEAEQETQAEAEAKVRDALLNLGDAVNRSRQTTFNDSQKSDDNDDTKSDDESNSNADTDNNNSHNDSDHSGGGSDLQPQSNYGLDKNISNDLLSYMSDFIVEHNLQANAGDKIFKEITLNKILNNHPQQPFPAQRSTSDHIGHAESVKRIITKFGL